MACKYRWEIGRIEEEKLEDEEELMISDEDRLAGYEEAAKSRSTFDPIRKKMSLANRRVNNLKENTKVNLPKAMSCKDEANMGVRIDNLRDAYTNYKKENCKDGGNKQITNLSREQKRG